MNNNNKHIPFYQQAQLTLSPARLDVEMELFPSKEIIWNRLVALASLVSAINPAFGDKLIFAKRSSHHHAQNEGFNVYLTSSNQAHPNEDDLIGQKAVSLWDALAKVLPPEVVSHEKMLIDSAPSFGFVSSIDAAIEDAFLRGYISLETIGTEIEGETFSSSNAYKVPDLGFMKHPTVARWVWISPEANKSLENDRISSSVNRIRKDVLRLRELLNVPFESATSEQKQEVKTRIQRLNDSRIIGGSFEDKYDHGWVGYALSKLNGNWTNFLVNEVGCSPHARYAKETPLMIALSQDDALALNDLLNQGLSPSVTMTQYPKIFDGVSQKRIDSRDESFIPLTLYASILESERCIKVLAEHGADFNMASDKGFFALQELAARGHDRLIRHLDQLGVVDVTQKDHENNTAAEYVPEGEQFNALHEYLLSRQEAVASAQALYEEKMARSLPEVKVIKAIGDSLKNRRQRQNEENALKANPSKQSTPKA